MSGHSKLGGFFLDYIEGNIKFCISENMNCQLLQKSNQNSVFWHSHYIRNHVFYLTVFMNSSKILQSLKIFGARFACDIDQNIKVEQRNGVEFTYS